MVDILKTQIQIKPIFQFRHLAIYSLGHECKINEFINLPFKSHKCESKIFSGLSQELKKQQFNNTILIIEVSNSIAVTE